MEPGMMIAVIVGCFVAAGVAIYGAMKAGKKNGDDDKAS